eukprot:3942804-Amphidinium_carterae.1
MAYINVNHGEIAGNTQGPIHVDHRVGSQTGWKGHHGGADWMICTHGHLAALGVLHGAQLHSCAFPGISALPLPTAD